MSFIHYRTKGFFLKPEDRGEADRLLTIFTEDFGKISVLGRAIRKIASKLRPAADIFYLSEIEFIQGKNYKTLTDAIAIEKFKNTRSNPGKLAIAYKIIEVLDFLTGYEEQDPEIWNLLNKSFFEIENWKTCPERSEGLKILFYYFLWSLLKILGYFPELYHCSVCSKKLLPETFYFSPKEGGVVCWRCFKNFSEKDREQAKEIKVDTVKILRILPQKSINCPVHGGTGHPFGQVCFGGFIPDDGASGYSAAEIKTFGRIKLEKKERENLKEISNLYLNFLKEELSKPEKE